ncbi:Hypothetical predicted protein [Paramuricea clavata]|uniref:Uncharacterized protein n=1 Tax=Paramuricea clavata TaxID=317549 RepID=A0A7D9DG08_PARCT|nr:Hypothetical predicted protein [Paramuricea clavata]
MWILSRCLRGIAVYTALKQGLLYGERRNAVRFYWQFWALEVSLSLNQSWSSAVSIYLNILAELFFLRQEDEYGLVKILEILYQIIPHPGKNL